MWIFIFVFVPLLPTFLNTELHHFYSRIWINTSVSAFRKLLIKWQLGRGALKQLKHCTNTWTTTTENGHTQKLNAGDGKPISSVGIAKAWILALLELPPSPDLVTITTTLGFSFPPLMPIPQHTQGLLNIHYHNRAPRWTYTISQKTCWGREEERNRYTHTALKFLIISLCRNTRNKSLNFFVYRDRTRYWWKGASK